MESGSEVVGKEERKKKYQIYVEEYVLSYLRRESDSLELSEIYFYGSRQESGRKLYVYGAGRDRGIAAFAEYEPLSELVCRLTQAGPVFLVREPDGECKTTGFQIFYDNNEAMQNYLLEWTGSAGKKRSAEKISAPEMPPVPTVFPEEKKRAPHGAMSVQLCLILVVLVAIVITSTDSYDKMEELNRSAKEVFFAIENQEADSDKADLAEDREIVVEREAGMSQDAGRADEMSDGQEPNADTGKATDDQEPDADTDKATDDQEPDADTDKAADKHTKDGDSVVAEEQEEGILRTVQDDSDGTDSQASEKGDEPEQTEETGDTSQKEKASSDTENKEEEKETAEQSEEENEEALSRSITRYYEVEQGDTLYTISKKIYGDISRVEKICEVNEISDPDKIRSGQRIILP